MEKNPMVNWFGKTKMALHTFTQEHSIKTKDFTAKVFILVWKGVLV